MKKDQANGFTMIEALMALLIASILASILFVQASTAHKALQLPMDDQEQFAILQIREMVSLSRTAQAGNSGARQKPAGQTAWIRDFDGAR